MRDFKKLYSFLFKLGYYNLDDRRNSFCNKGCSKFPGDSAKNGRRRFQTNPVKSLWPWKKCRHYAKQ